MHELCIMHRDLKPENILYEEIDDGQTAEDDGADENYEGEGFHYCITLLLFYYFVQIIFPKCMHQSPHEALSQTLFFFNDRHISQPNAHHNEGQSKDEFENLFDDVVEHDVEIPAQNRDSSTNEHQTNPCSTDRDGSESSCIIRNISLRMI